MPFQFDQEDNAPQEVGVLSERQCYQMIQQLISFPYSQVCVHYAAGLIIEEMEQSGMTVDRDFSRAVTRAQDDVSLTFLQQKLA